MAASQSTNYTQGYSKSTLSSHGSRTVHSDAAFLLPHVRETDKILDVGCGPGTITVGFAEYVPLGSVVGIDLSEAVIENARTHLEQTRALDSTETTERPVSGEVKFLVADLLTGLPFLDDTFDIVFSSQLFPHLPPPDMPLRAMSEMRRVLKPGGILATRDIAEMHWYPRRLGIEERWRRNMLRGSGMPDFPGPSMPVLLQAAGFDIDGRKGGKAVIGAGTSVVSGAERRKWWVDGYLGRLAEGDAYRESWIKAGVTVGEIEEIKTALVEWMGRDDAWYVGLQSEILAWK